jgi:4-diphosphocytidyl-2-C-methyl-D-erythritol kinase
MPLIKTPAKVNLFLNLLGQRPDGFHNVQMVMQTISLFDELIVEKLWDSVGVEWESNIDAFNKEPNHNLVVKAYYRFFQYLEEEPFPVKIKLQKNIPMEAGLGGGSSNAAGMLKLLNLMKGNPLNTQQLKDIASTLGADVSFFLSGGTALATQRGEVIEPIVPGLPQLPMVLIYPIGEGVSTKQAYQWVREANRYQSEDNTLEKLKRHLHNESTVESLMPYLWNDFEAVVYPKCLGVGYIAETLKAVGLKHPLLCGSGATVMSFLHDVPDFSMSELISHLDTLFPETHYRVMFVETGKYGH